MSETENNTVLDAGVEHEQHNWDVDQYESKLKALRDELALVTAERDAFIQIIRAVTPVVQTVWAHAQATIAPYLQHLAKTGTPPAPYLSEPIEENPNG